MNKTEAEIQKVLEEWDKGDFPLVENKCKFCDYTCKTMGWRNGVIQHMRTNHKDKFFLISRKQHERYFLSQSLHRVVEVAREEIKEIQADAFKRGVEFGKSLSHSVYPEERREDKGGGKT